MNAGHVDVVMPQLGMNMDEGEIVEWFVTPGSNVTVGGPLCAVVTDKVEVTVEAPASGTVEIIWHSPAAAPVGAVIARIIGEGPA